MTGPAFSQASLLRLARLYARLAGRWNPYLRLLAVTGSVARAREGHHTDLDFFVVARRGRVWPAFFLCLLLGWWLCRRLGLPRQVLCFNYVVDEGAPEEVDLSRPEYGQELLRLRVLFGGEAYRALLSARRDALEPLDPVRFRQALEEASVLPPAPPGPRGWRRVLVALLALAGTPLLVGAVKWRERWRRRAYPQGRFVSGLRCIRIHLRAGWGEDPTHLPGLPSASAFSRLAPSYEEEVVATLANRLMRARVWQVLEGWVRPGIRTLDVGAGTGTDALWMARRGAQVLAVDPAPGMVETARRRVREAGLEGRVEVRLLAAEDLRTLLPLEARRYHLALANFGPLNVAGEPDRWAPALARLLRPDGVLVATVMNRWCLWELAGGLLRGRLRFALRRPLGLPIEVGGVPLRVRLYTPGGLARALAPWFRIRYVEGMGVAFPPPPMEGFLRRFPRLAGWLARLDPLLGRLPLFRALGDHFLAVLEPHEGPRFLYRVGEAVTASPVVADLNDDGAPEVVLPARRLHLLDRHGRPLPGSPRRLGGPMASTPAVRENPEGALLFVGSDDDRLHALQWEGHPLPGFPFPTGGDIFSSPWVGDLNGDGRPEVVFGSDDGRIYAVDLSGRPLPGWPVETGGFVSASPAVARCGSTPTVFIGSWDGRFYALDPQGRHRPGWPQELGVPLWSSPALADVDGDGEPEVFIAGRRLHAFRADGTPLPGFPVDLGAYAVASPALGDLDGDGRPEVVVGADCLYAFRTDGTPLPGFPVDLGAYLWASPILVDLDGDGRPEVVVADWEGRVWAVRGDGKGVPGWPRRAGHRVVSTPLAADLDGDRFLELLVATADGRLLAWPTECPDDPARAPWPAFVPRGPRPLLPARPVSFSPGLPLPDPPAAVEERAPPTLTLHPRTPRPYRVTEVHLRLPFRPRYGFLYYRVDGQEHPSPLLVGGGRAFALIQPLPPLKRVTFHLEAEGPSGETVRLPEQGTYRFTVGLPGLRRGT